MKLNIEITSDSSELELKALANLFVSLAYPGEAMRRGVPPLDITATPVPSQVYTVADDQPPTGPCPEEGGGEPGTKVTRRRRTKAEIVAEDQAKAGESAPAPVAEERDPATEPGHTLNAEPASTPEVEDALPTSGGPEADDGEKAFTEGEVQALATLIARSKGPDVVRNKITELGGTRISALTAAQINALGAFLESQQS